MSSAPGMCSAISDVTSGGIKVSPSDVTINAGTSIAPRSGVESSRSAMPTAAAAIDSAGCSAIVSRT